ncbi:MAG: nitrilase-related carbon-nitrogen hydrolase, partial [Sphingomonas sp.]
GMPAGQIQFGGSAIIAPDGSIIAQAGSDADLLIAELDLMDIGRGLTSLDTDGHYARPDIFDLRIDRRPRAGFSDAPQGFEKV